MVTFINVELKGKHMKGYLKDIKQYVAPWHESVIKGATNNTI